MKKILFVNFVFLLAGLRAGAETTLLRSPLQEAADSLENHSERIESLIKAGASVNAADEQGNTALHLAARRVSAPNLDSLLRNGASVYARNQEGRTPLQSLYNLGDEDYYVPCALIKIFRAAHAEFSAKDREGRTVLHLAARKIQEPNCVRDILESGGNPNERDALGKSALHYVASPLTAQALIFGGAEIEARDLKGYTPLHDVASRYGESNSLEIMDELVRSGADVDARSFLGETPLHLLARGLMASRASAAKLIELGASVNALDDLGNTPSDLAKVAKNGLDRDLLKKFGGHCHRSCTVLHPSSEVQPH